MSPSEPARHLSMIRGFHLADFLTLGNAACGVIAIFAVMAYVETRDLRRLLAAAALIPLALVFDVLDGRVARSRRKHSAMGRELDSLADVIGSLQDRDLLDRVFKNPDALHENVAAAMQPPLAAIDADEKLDEVFSTLSGRQNAVVVAQGGKPIGVLTRTDLLEFLAHRR